MQDKDKTKSQLIAELNAMRKSVEERDRLFNLSLDMLCIAGYDGFLKQVNPAWSKILGWTSEELIGNPWIEFVHPDDRADTLIAADRLKRELQLVSWENRYRQKDGGYRWISWNTTALPNERLYFSVVRDITERKKAEESLRESEEKYRNIFNNAGVGIFRSRWIGSETLDVNDKFLKILKRTREEIIGKPSVTIWADSHEREEMVRRLNADGKVADVEYRMLTTQGEERTCLTSLTLYPDQGILEGSITDITERKRMEENVLASEQRIKAITNSAFDAIILINDRGEVSYWNPASERIFGYSASEVMGKNVHELLAPPGFQAAYRSAFKDFVTSGRGNALGKITPLVARRKDGEEFPIELSLSGFQAGGRWQAAGIVRDITERKHADQRILNVLAYAKNITNTVREPLVVLDGEMRVVSANYSFYRMFGVTSEETQGNLLYDLGNRQWDIPRLHELLEEILPEKAEVRDFEVDHVFPEIGHKILFLNARQVIRGYGEEERKLILLAIEDISDRKRTEKEKEELIIELQKALFEVKTLSGFLPICAWCKKIRDDEGYWNEIERYIGEHTETQFSHGICPDCMRKQYPEYAEEIIARLEKDEKK